MEQEDRQYIDRVLKGDKEAFSHLIDAYQGMVFAVALNITGNYHDSEDVVQEHFIRLNLTLGVRDLWFQRRSAIGGEEEEE